MGDSINCREPLDSFAVLANKKKWLGFRKDKKDSYLYSTYQKQVIIQVKAAWETIQSMEKAVYGDKSFFIWKQDKGKAPLRQDEEYIVISYSEDMIQSPPVGEKRRHLGDGEFGLEESPPKRQR